MLATSHCIYVCMFGMCVWMSVLLKRAARVQHITHTHTLRDCKMDVKVWHILLYISFYVIYYVSKNILCSPLENILQQYILQRISTHTHIYSTNYTRITTLDCGVKYLNSTGKKRNNHRPKFYFHSAGSLFLCVFVAKSIDLTTISIPFTVMKTCAV